MESLWSGSIDGWSEPPPDPARGDRRRRSRRRTPEPALAGAGSAGRAVGLPSTADEDERAADVLVVADEAPPADATPAPTPPDPPASTPAPDCDAVGIAGGSARPKPLPVEVIRSSKRRKTVSARIVGGRIVVRMPHGMTAAQEHEHVASLVARLERQRVAHEVDLPARAATLAGRYGLPLPSSIRFVSNQSERWGSCTPATSEIRISDRIAGFPEWVLDAVIVHELAHLVHLGHTPEFWAMANRYPKTERAYGFLIAMQMTDDEIELL